MKKMIIAVVLCVALTACACFSWMFAKSDIQCLLFLILALFPYPLFEEGRKEYRNSKVGGAENEAGRCRQDGR